MPGAGAVIGAGALGAIGSIAGGLFGSSSAKKAAQLQAAAQMKAIEEQRRQFESTQQNFSPFLQAGTGAIPQVQQDATLGGFGQQIGQIFGGGALDPLIEERTRAVQGQLAAGGLTRSGTALQEIAAIPAQLGFNLEGLLAGRRSNLFGSGLQAAAQLGGLGQQSVSNITGLQSGLGAIQGAGVLGQGAGQAAAIRGATSGIGNTIGLASQAGLFNGGGGGQDEFGNFF